MYNNNTKMYVGQPRIQNTNLNYDTLICTVVASGSLMNKVSAS